MCGDLIPGVSRHNTETYLGGARPRNPRLSVMSSFGCMRTVAGCGSGTAAAVDMNGTLCIVLFLSGCDQQTTNNEKKGGHFISGGTLTQKTTRGTKVCFKMLCLYFFLR